MMGIVEVRLGPLFCLRWDGNREYPGLAAYVVTVAYRELEFLQIDAGPNLAGLSREKLACDVTSSGEVCPF